MTTQKVKPETNTSPLKVAIVHDWLTNMGGAEPLVLEMHKLYPDAPIYTSVYDADKMPSFNGLDIQTTYLQKILPKSLRYKHVLWPVLRAHAFRKLDMSEYDLILSSSTAESKSVKKRSDAIHICYCNTPTRYYWSHYQEFKNSFNFGLLTPLIRPIIPIFVSWMRKLDLQAVRRVDHFIANSNEVKHRIRKYYNRDSTVIFPAVETKRFSKVGTPTDRHGFITWGRHVPYKRIDLAIEACNRLSLPLTVVGSGPETDKLKKLAGSTITFTGRVSEAELIRLAQSAEAFLFTGDEDFGISPVEALSAGTPVIAYRAGGALDYVVENETGIFFNDQTVNSLVGALQKYDSGAFDHKRISKFADRFSVATFKTSLKEYIDKTIT